MTEKALMALFDEGHRLELPSGYYLQKRDENTWHIGGPLGGISCLLGFQITSSVPVGRDGSMDHEVKRFAEAMAAPQSLTPGQG